MTSGILLRGAVAYVLIAAIISAAFPPEHVFHFLNACVLATAMTVVTAYYPGLRDIYQNPDHPITGGHLLTVGIVMSWLGLIIRLGRWYIFNTEPNEAGLLGFPQWVYNVGLWATLGSGIALVTAVMCTEDSCDRRRLAKLFAFALITGLILGLIDHLS